MIFLKKKKYVHIHVYIFICVHVGTHVYVSVYMYVGLESRGQLQSNPQRGYVSPLRMASPWPVAHQLG